MEVDKMRKKSQISAIRDINLHLVISVGVFNTFTRRESVYQFRSNTKNHWDKSGFNDYFKLLALKNLANVS